jgi:hypothetical protein
MTSTTPTTPASLLSLPNDAFRTLVDADLRGKGDQSLAKLLRSEEVCERWYSTINGMAKSVEGQLAAKRADLEATTLSLESDIQVAEARGDESLAAQLRLALMEAQQKDAKWRAGILRFKTGLEEVHAEARRIRDSFKGSFFESYLAEERNIALARVRDLEDGIRRHRDHDCETDPRCKNTYGESFHDCAADDDLWSLVS